MATVAASATAFFFSFPVLAVFALWGFIATFFTFVFGADVRLDFFTARFVIFLALDFFFILRAMIEPLCGHGFTHSWS
jgi:hypothetical protein